MTSVFVFILSLVVKVWIADAVTELDVGRTFLLNSDYLPWDTARQVCQAMNGHLAKIDQLHVVPELEYTQDWTLWVGLKMTSPDNLTWEDGTQVNWTNWHTSLDSDTENPLCVSVITSSPYSWIRTSCDKALPSLCEVSGGSCRFTLTSYASLQGYNDRIEYMDKDSCLRMCETTRELDCRSVEVNRETAICQLSSQTRWTEPRNFITGTRYWDYYHWTCINGSYMTGVTVLPNGVDIPTSNPATSSVAITTAPPLIETTERDGDEDTVCIRVKHVTENETKAVEEEVQQLQTLARVYKEQSRQKKKISTPDARPSATYVGSLAVAMVVVVLGVIVCLDVLSLPRYLDELQRQGAPCGKCAKLIRKSKLSRKSKRIRFTEYSACITSRPHARPLFLNSRMPHNFKPDGLGMDRHVETVYSQGQEDVVHSDTASCLEPTPRLEIRSGTSAELQHAVMDDPGTSADISDDMHSGSSSMTNRERVGLEKLDAPTPRHAVVVHERLVSIERNPDGSDDSFDEVLLYLSVDRSRGHDPSMGSQQEDKEYTEQNSPPFSRSADSLVNSDISSQSGLDPSAARDRQQSTNSLKLFIPKIAEMQTDNAQDVPESGWPRTQTGELVNQETDIQTETSLQQGGEDREGVNLSAITVAVTGDDQAGVTVQEDRGGNLQMGGNVETAADGRVMDSAVEDCDVSLAAGHGDLHAESCPDTREAFDERL